MDIPAGTYTKKGDVRVTYWKAPDAKGDGPEVWEDQHDAALNYIGRNMRVDRQGEPVRTYSPPTGFTNHPGFDHTDNYVRMDERGRVLRNIAGEAISIKPGQVLLEYPDGTTKYLNDDHSIYLFLQAHDLVSDTEKEAGK